MIKVTYQSWRHGNLAFFFKVKHCNVELITSQLSGPPPFANVLPKLIRR